MTDKGKPAGERNAAHPRNDAASANSPQALRQQAERLLKKNALSPENIETLSFEATQQMLHELRVHQIELEIQNEELRESQIALDVVQARYFDLYDLAPVGYCTISEQGLILQANLTAASLLGVTRAALIKKPLSQFIVKADQDLYYLRRKKLLETGEPQSFELQVVKNDGTQLWVHLAVTAAQDADGAPELRAVLIDITERKQVTTELQMAMATAEKANLAKSDFLSNMSHELRTPLSAILGFTQLIESSSPSPTPSQKRSIDQILKAGWYLLDLINEILDLALIESGKLTLSMEPISLIEIVRECQSMIETQAQKHDISIAFPRIKSPCFVNGDRTRIKQILINLLSNAIKYNKVGGTVVVSCIANSRGRIRICVEDTGEGLAADKLTQLFQPFNRLGNKALVEEGTGIGLVMTKRLIELMGGTIGVESTVGVGSVFWIELNLTAEPQPAAVADALSAATPRQFETDAKPHTLLYVEDNPANLMLVEEIIARRPDIRLLSARDGIRGVELARESLPDVILMDLSLPGISGLHALGILRKDPATAHIPVIALSANAIPRDIEIGLEAGFFRYLTKPIKVNEFMDTLDAVLKHAETEAARTAKKKRT